MTDDAETFDLMYDRSRSGVPAGTSEALIGLIDLAGEIGRALGARALTDSERHRLYMRASALVDSGLVPGRAWTERVFQHRRAVLGGAVAALAAAGAVGFVVHERRAHHPRPGLRIAA